MALTKEERQLTITQAYNYRIIESILKGLRKYWAFTLNEEDYDEVFQIGKRGEILRPQKGELDNNIIYKLSKWSGIPTYYLYGERAFTTGIYLIDPISKKELSGLSYTKGKYVLCRFDNALCKITEKSALDCLWDDPLGLDNYNIDDKEAQMKPAPWYDMDILLEALVFRLKRSGRLDSVPSLHPRQNRALGEPTRHLYGLANLLLAVTGRVPLIADRSIVDLENALAILHYGAPLEKWVCKLATATREKI